MPLALTQNVRVRFCFTSWLVASLFAWGLCTCGHSQTEGSSVGQGAWITSVAASAADDSVYSTVATSLLLRAGMVQRSSAEDLSRAETIGETPTSAWKVLVLSNGKGFVVSDYQGNLLRRPLEAGSEPKQLATGLRWVRAMAEIPASRLVVGTEDGKLVVLDLEKDNEVARVDGHTSQIMQLAVFGDQLVSCAADGVVKSWNISDLSLIREYKLASTAIWSAVFSSDHRYLVSGGTDRRLQLHDAETGKLIMTLGILPDWVTAIQPLSTDVVAAGCMNGRIYIFHIPSKLRVKELQGPGSAIWCLTASSDGRRLIAGTRKHGIIEIKDHNWERELQGVLARFATEHPPSPK